ncbi:MAG: methionyl-tRNA formyltransferase [Alphaproteobacteria bacterium]|nr:methionyl-tRNA formyltransferase [Alphaproteobacteria bacterium]
MRLVFMGTPDFAVPTMRALLDAGHEFLAVYSQPARPAGRGQRERLSPVHEFAAAHGLPVRTPASLRDAGVQAEFAALRPDVAVVVAYGLILPRPILAAPRLGCINLHASLLPRWRGAAPIQRAIMAGDRETGVAAMQMEAGLDTGPVLLERRLPIGPDTTAGELHDRLAEDGARVMVQALSGLATGRLRPRPQAEEGVTYASKIEKEECRIDWRRGAAELDCMIRGLSPFPGAFAEIGGERIRILLARPVEGHGAPGEVLDGDLTVACGRGALRLLRLQRAGREPLAAAEFLRGFPIRPGQRFD